MKKGNILVVDDNKNVLTALRILLQSYFERVTLLNSPKQLHATLAEVSPDVVLLDMNFSAGLNTGNEGLFWLSEIKKLDADLPVVLFTAYADIELAVEALKRGACDFVVKPWDNAKLVATLQAAYALTLPACPVSHSSERKSVVEALGLRAFTLFRQKRMALFFIFSMCLGICLQITNGFASPFIFSFGSIPEYADTFGVQHANILISISQISETCCILLIPYFLSRFGIKRVMLIAMLAWVFRFGFFAIGNPGSGVWLFVLSMLVYGVAFDFFNVSGSLFVDKETDMGIRSSAQGLFMMMTNGLGATIGTLAAQAVINHFVYALPETATGQEVIAGWNTCWFLFAGYALVVAVLFALLFKYKHVVKDEHAK